MSYQTNLFINGKYVPSSSGETLTIHSPNDDSLVTDKIQAASEADVDAAVAAAKAAFPQWRDTAGHKRAAIMLKFADLLEANVDKLAHLESVAMGQVCRTSIYSAATLLTDLARFRGEAYDSWSSRSVEVLRRLLRQGCW